MRRFFRNYKSLGRGLLVAFAVAATSACSSGPDRAELIAANEAYYTRSSAAHSVEEIKKQVDALAPLLAEMIRKVPRDKRLVIGDGQHSDVRMFAITLSPPVLEALKERRTATLNLEIPRELNAENDKLRANPETYRETYTRRMAYAFRDTNIHSLDEAVYLYNALADGVVTGKKMGIDIQFIDTNLTEDLKQASEPYWKQAPDENRSLLGAFREAFYTLYQKGLDETRQRALSNDVPSKSLRDILRDGFTDGLSSAADLNEKVPEGLTQDQIIPLVGFVDARVSMDKNRLPALLASPDTVTLFGRGHFQKNMPDNLFALIQKAENAAPVVLALTSRDDIPLSKESAKNHSDALLLLDYGKVVILNEDAFTPTQAPTPPAQAPSPQPTQQRHGAKALTFN